MQTLYIGNYSNKEMDILSFNNDMIIEGTYKYRVQRSNPSYLCINNDFLYSVAEIQDDVANSGYVASYKIANNKFEFLNEKISYGNDPCYVIYNKLFNVLFVANYTGGSFSAFKINRDGSIGHNIYKMYYGPNSNIHQIQFSNDFKNIYVVDLGLNKIIEYKIIYNNNVFNLEKITDICFCNNEKPRHIVLDSFDNLYAITEKSCEIYKIAHNKKNELSICEKKSILPENKSIKSSYTGCAIKIDNKKEYIYVSIRGNNSISVFNIKNGMDLIQNISCEGNCPRDITLSKNGQYLFCANQLSDNISIFDINRGFITFKDKYSIKAPTCICIK